MTLPFTINEVVYQVPTNWNAIEFGHYLSIINASQKEVKPLELLSVITGIPADVLGKCELWAVQQIADLVSFVHEPDSLDAYNVVDDKFANFDIRNESYENFEYCNQIVKNKWAELYPDEKQLTEWQVMHVYLNASPEIVKTYLDIDILSMPIPATYGLAVFFCKEYRNLTTHTVN